MILLIGRPLEYSMKVIGLWPFSDDSTGALALASTIFALIPFQFWKTFELIEDFIAMMANLSDIIAEVSVLIKFFILWKNKRSVQRKIYKLLFFYTKSLDKLFEFLMLIS